MRIKKGHSGYRLSVSKGWLVFLSLLFLLPFHSVNASDQQYGPVKPGETLWRIATRYQQPGISMSEMVEAIFRANPEAFDQQNINLLRAGSTLTIPFIGSNEPDDTVENVGLNDEQETEAQHAGVSTTETETALAPAIAEKPTDDEEVDAGVVIEAEPAEIQETVVTAQTDSATQSAASNPAPAPPPARPLFRYSYDLSYVYDDNVRLAQNDVDIVDDSIASLLVKATAGKQLDAFNIVSYGFQVGYDGYAEYSDLSHATFSANARYRFATSSGFSAPVYSFRVKLGGREFSSEMRDSTDGTISFDLNKWLTNRLNMTLGIGYQASEAKSQAYDTRQTRLFGNLDLEISKTGLLYGTYAYSQGDIVSSATPTLDIINAAEVIEPDDAFGGVDENQFAYRLDADTQVLTLGYNQILTRGLSLDVSLRFVDSEVDTDTDDELGYERGIARISLLGRF